MPGTLEVGLKAYLHPRHQHCTDEAQKAETGVYIYVYIFFLLQILALLTVISF